MTTPVTRLQSALADNGLYAAIIDLDNQAISELSQALQAALNVAHNCVYLRTREEPQS